MGCTSETCVYVVQPEQEPFVKIGFTASPMSARLADLQVGNPRALRVIERIPADEMADEGTIHVILDEYRVRGEWFRYEGDVFSMVTYIGRLRELRSEAKELDLRPQREIRDPRSPWSEPGDQWSVYREF